MSFVSKWFQKCHAARLSKYNQEVINKEHFIDKYPKFPFSTNFLNEIMILTYGYENSIADDDSFPVSHIQWNEKIFYGYKEISYLKLLDMKCESSLKSANSKNLEDIHVDRNHSPSIDESTFFNAKEPPGSNLAETVKDVRCWFPLWIDGVCKIVCQLHQPQRTVITGAVLSYSHSEKLFTTLYCSYKFTDGIDIEFMGKYVKFLQEMPLEILGKFDGDNWLQFALKLSLLSRNGFFACSSKPITKLSGCRRSQFINNIIGRAQLKKQLKRPRNSERPVNYLSICEELETIASAIQESARDWVTMFQAFLLRHGENVSEKFAGIDSQNPVARPVDLDTSQESISYENFSGGEKCNSTFTNLDGKLVLWSVTRNPIGQFCISGMKLTNGRQRFIEIDPVAIGSVMNSGKAVIADKCCYELLGPMYPLSIRLAVPSASNIDYIWPLLTHFTNGLPLHWKCFAQAIDVLCKCSPLRPHESSSMLFLTPIPASRSTRNSQSSNSHTISDTNTILMMPDVRLDRLPIVVEKAVDRSSDANIHQSPTTRSILDISPVLPQRPVVRNHEEPPVSSVAVTNINTRKRRTESSHSVGMSSQLPMKKGQLQNQRVKKKKCSFAIPLISMSGSDFSRSRSVSGPAIRGVEREPQLNYRKKAVKNSQQHRARSSLFDVDFTPSRRHSLDYSQYIVEYMCLNDMVQTTRSGRKSLPPLDPRFDLEYKIENEKVFLLSNGEKFELASRVARSHR